MQLDIATPGFQKAVLPSECKHVMAVVARLTGADPRDVYLAGGPVRDLALGNEPYNYDVAVNAGRAAIDADTARRIVGWGALPGVQPREGRNGTWFMHGQAGLLLDVNGLKVVLNYSDKARDVAEVADSFRIGLSAIAANAEGAYLTRDFTTDAQGKTLTLRNIRTHKDAEQAVSKIRTLIRVRLPGYSPRPEAFFR